MNRGSSIALMSLPLALQAASMRPRFMNRGSSSRCGDTMDSNQRFNEAPIHESGKYSFPARVSVRKLGFNEAPIHESGKL